MNEFAMKERARSLLASAIAAGQVNREGCRDCGESRAEGHHEDYRKPYKVIWLCRKHHKAEHRRLRLAGKTPIVGMPKAAIRPPKKRPNPSDRSVSGRVSSGLFLAARYLCIEQRCTMKSLVATGLALALAEAKAKVRKVA